MGNTTWRAELLSVEKLLDELWIAEKFQSNLELAGSPRNVFRYSLACCPQGVEHYLGDGDEMSY